MVDQERLASVVGSMDLSNALAQVQWALLRIRTDMESLGVRLDTADLSLETVREVTAGGEVTIAVVTVAGSLASKTTTTLSISLRPPAPKKDDGFRSLTEVQDDLVDLSQALFAIIKEAAESSTVKLEFNSGSVKVELVVDEKGSLKVAVPGLIKELLKRIGFDASASVEANWVSTSSITFNFGNAADPTD